MGVREALAEVGFVRVGVWEIGRKSAISNPRFLRSFLILRWPPWLFIGKESKVAQTTGGQSVGVVLVV